MSNNKKHKLKNIAIIPAAGKGIRFNAKEGKLFIKIKDKPLLWHTLQPFIHSKLIDEIILIFDPLNMEKQKEIVMPWFENKPFYIVQGGVERQESIYNALKFLQQNNLKPETVIVHDGARPYVTKTIIEECITKAKKLKAVITAVAVTDTIKQSDGKDKILKTIPRENLWSVQTPQAYDYEILLNAYNKAYQDNFLGTDDAMLLERLNINVYILKGEYSNIKITTKEDLNLRN